MAFQLKQDKKESENKTIRFPVPLIQRIEAAIQNQNVSFSSFVIQACEYALHDMEKEILPRYRKQTDNLPMIRLYKLHFEWIYKTGRY